MAKKNEPIIGIINSEKNNKLGRQKKVTMFFADCVEVYFVFYEKEFGLKPSFDGSAPRDLKWIVDSMQKRSEENEVEWNCDIAKRMLQKFLEVCLQDQWLKENFLLSNLNRQKDKIFIKIKSEMNGKSNSSQKANSYHGKTAGQAVYAERFRQQSNLLKK